MLNPNKSAGLILAVVVGVVFTTSGAMSQTAPIVPAHQMPETIEVRRISDAAANGVYKKIGAGSLSDDYRSPSQPPYTLKVSYNSTTKNVQNISGLTLIRPTGATTILFPTADPLMNWNLNWLMNKTIINYTYNSGTKMASLSYGQRNYPMPFVIQESTAIEQKPKVTVTSYMIGPYNAQEGIAGELRVLIGADSAIPMPNLYLYIDDTNGRTITSQLITSNVTSTNVQTNWTFDYKLLGPIVNGLPTGKYAFNIEAKTRTSPYNYLGGSSFIVNANPATDLLGSRLAGVNRATVTNTVNPALPLSQKALALSNLNTQSLAELRNIANREVTALRTEAGGSAGAQLFITNRITATNLETWTPAANNGYPTYYPYPTANTLNVKVAENIRFFLSTYNGYKTNGNTATKSITNSNGITSISYTYGLTPVNNILIPYK